MSLILTAALPAPFVKAAGGNVVRIGEADRYATAAKVATTNWSNPKDLILVCGEGYADAVSASVLSKKLDAPIIMTNSNSLNENAKSALSTLKPQNVYVIGGYASVSKSIRNYLNNGGYNVIELSGKNRYETNAAVANELVKLGMKADKVMLVSGEGFSDALSVAPIAAAKGEILLLGTNNSNEMKSVFDFVKNNNSQVTVVGTSNSINDSIYNKLGAVDRVNGGANRFETNLNVLRKFKGDLKNDKIFVANATSEDGYADALVASSLAGKYSSNLVLVDGENDSATEDAIGYIKENIGDSTDLNVIGGTGVVSDTLVDKIKSNSNKPTPADTPTVQSVTTNGLNQIKVTFNIDLDKDTAEMLSNYEVDGTKLSSSYQSKTVANIQDDKRTILITFSQPFAQGKNVDFKVRNGILDQSTTKIINEYTQQKLTFKDTTKPEVTVKAVGGNKLVVRFSKPVRMTDTDLNVLKINKKNVQNYSLNKSQTKLVGKDEDWVDGVDLYFDSTLPEGNNIMVFPAGNVGQNFDTAAGIPLDATTLSFNVASVDGFPKVKSAVSNNGETLYVTYDRPMDKVTALNNLNYTINSKDVTVNSSDIYFDSGSNDTVVKIEKVDDLITKGDNKLVVKDKVTDTYGNAIRESTVPFTVSDSNILPQVTGASIVDNKTIRVKFNKTVSDYSATNKSNYKLVDNSTSEDITYKVASISGVNDESGDSLDTFDMKLQNIDDLKASSYTLSIKNIFDTSSPANVMGSYSTILEGNGGKVKVTSIVKKSDSSRDVVVFFNKAMDSTTINNSENYFFVDGTGETRSLPTNAVILQSDDCKSVTITFPSGYTISEGSTDRYVVKFGVGNVKDQSGTMLDSVAYSSKISTDYNQGPSIIEETGKLVYSGNDAIVTVSVSDNLEVLNISDFRINGQTPDAADMNGKNLIFTFRGSSSDNKKIESLRSAGNSTSINVSSSTTADAAGRTIRSGSYTLLLPPVTDSSDWTAKSSNSSITMKFNQNIDGYIASSYNDDFIFKNENTGKKLNVVAVRVDDNHNIIYSFEDGSMKAGDVIDVRANDNTNNINIRGKEYGNGYYAVFSPSNEDLNARTVVVH